MKKTLLSAALALLLSACTEQAALQVAALQGTVYEVGGQSLDLAGVEVTLLETGEIATTDSNGEFDFEKLAPGMYRLEFGSRIASLEFGEEDREGEDEVDEHEIEVEITSDGGDVEIHVAIEDDGRVIDVAMGDDEARDATSYLRPPEGSEVRVEGSIKLKSTRDGERFEVAVYGLDAGATIDLCIGEDRIGSATANADGVARFVRESGNLPLAKERLEGLFGRRLSVKFEGELILFGEIPDLPEEREGDDREGDGENGDGEDGDREDGDGKEGDGKDGDGENGDREDGNGEDGDGEDGDGESDAR